MQHNASGEKRHRALLKQLPACLTAACLVLSSTAYTIACWGDLLQSRPMFCDLFNGKDLEGWVVEDTSKLRDGSSVWRVEEGKIVANAGKSAYGFLRYAKREFGDFTLRVEYRFLPPDKNRPRGNSGVGIRTIPYDRKRSDLTRPSYAAYEIQLLDNASQPPSKYGTGSLYRYVAPRSNPVKPAPEWNLLEISCSGPKICVRLNGAAILEADQRQIPDIPDKPPGVLAPKDKPLTGYICLQSHTGTVEFRGVQICEHSAKTSHNR